MARGTLQGGYNASQDLRRATRSVGIVWALYTSWMYLGSTLYVPCMRLACALHVAAIC